MIELELLSHKRLKVERTLYGFTNNYGSEESMMIMQPKDLEYNNRESRKIY